MGGKLGTIFARVGHKLVFSHAAKGKTSLKIWHLGRKAMHEQARHKRQRKMLMRCSLRCTSRYVDDVLKRTGDLSDKVIVACSLPMADNTKLIIANDSSGAGAC